MPSRYSASQEDKEKFKLSKKELRKADWLMDDIVARRCDYGGSHDEHQHDILQLVEQFMILKKKVKLLEKKLAKCSCDTEVSDVSDVATDDDESEEEEDLENDQ